MQLHSNTISMIIFWRNGPVVRSNAQLVTLVIINFVKN